MSEAELPTGWAKRSLGEVVDVRTSNVDKKTVRGEIPVRLCNYMDVYANDYVRADLPFMEATATRPEIDRFGLEVGDVIITKDSETPDDIGIPTVVDETVENLVCGYHLALLKPDRAAVEPLYLSKFLSTDRVSSHFLARANGSTRYGLTQDSIHSVPLLVPPLPTQRRIAEVLRTVDEVIEWTEKRLEKQQAIKQGLLHDLFTRGLTPEGKLRPSPTDRPDLYQDSPLGPIPKEWEVRRIREIGAVKGGKRVPLGESFADGPTPHPYLRVVDMKDWGIDDAELEYLESRVARMIARYTISSDDLYITIAGTLGMVGRVPPHLDGAQLTENAAKICELDLQEVSPDFLCGFMNSHGFQRQVWAEIGTGGGVPKLALFRIAAMSLPVPALDEQQAIGERIQVSINEAVELQAELAKLRHLKSALMQDLLTGRVSAAAIDLEAIAS